MYERLGPIAIRVLTQTATPTEFAVIINGVGVTEVSCPMLTDLGFDIDPTRQMVYRRAHEMHLGPLAGIVAVQVMKIARPTDGKWYVTVGPMAKVADGKWLYGFVVDWPEGAFRCEHDYAEPGETVPVSSRFVFERWSATRRWREHR